MSSGQNFCAVCKTPASQICAGCKNVYYCNREHQKKHWKEGHKNNCCSYKIVANDTIGHHLVATRDIKQNEIIFKDIPIISGPSKSSNIYCTGCYKRLKQEYRCQKCNWPLCSKKCEEKMHKIECNVLKDKVPKENSEILALEKNKYIFGIPTLRCLLMKESSPQKYEILRSLPPPTPSKEQLNNIQSNIIPFIQSTLNLPIPEQEIIDMAAKFEIYSYEILKKDEVTINCRVIYPIATFLYQDCKPNTKHTFIGENHQAVFISTVPIGKGEKITTSHAEILWGTLARRAYLLETRNFSCQCTRCSDQTEFGTYLGAIFCCECKKPDEESCPKILSTDSLNQNAVWKCEKCDHKIRGRQMVWGNDAIKSEIGRIDKRIPINLEKFLVKYKETLHPKNYHALIVKYTLMQIYGNQPGYLYADLTDEILERKLEICHELLDIMDELSPGFSKIRGSILYEMQATMVVQTKRELKKGNVTKENAQETMAECLTILKEASQILSSEPEMREYLKENLEKFVQELE